MEKRSFFGFILIFLFFTLSSFGLVWAQERYVVKPGDSLYHISNRFGVSMEAIKEANGLKGPLIKPKQVLLIPTSRVEYLRGLSEETLSYTVKPGDSLYQISKSTGCSIDEIKRLNHLQSVHLKIGQTLLLPKRVIPMEEEMEEWGDGGEVHESIEPNERVIESNGRWNGPEERNLFIRVVKSFLGIPYRLGGSTIRGIDCSAFVKKIYEIFNISLPRTAKEQLRIGKKVEREELAEGDLVFFKTRRPHAPHVGIYIGNNEFIHASSRGKEVRIDRLDTPYFHTRFLRGVRIKEMEGDS
jgi:LysM repeat protein